MKRPDENTRATAASISALSERYSPAGSTIGIGLAVMGSACASGEARLALAHQASDLERELEHAAALGAVDGGRLALAHRVDERSGLRLQRVVALVRFLALL